VSPVPAPNLQFDWLKYVVKSNPTDLIGQPPLWLGLATKPFEKKSLIANIHSNFKMNEYGFIYQHI